MESLTELERAAIFYHVFGGCKDRKLLFQIAEGENRVKRLNESSLKTTYNNWFKSHKIQTGIKYFEGLKNEKIEEIKRSCTSSEEIEPIKRAEPVQTEENVNFLDRDEFLSFLNTRANEIQDDKLRNDILKMLSDNLRYKDTERDENNEIQRFYTPVICESCPIYQKCSSCSGCSTSHGPR